MDASPSILSSCPDGCRSSDTMHLLTTDWGSVCNGRVAQTLYVNRQTKVSILLHLQDECARLGVDVPIYMSRGRG